VATVSCDTAPEIEETQIEHLRDMPTCRELVLVAEMSRTEEAMALAGLRQRHPNDTPEQRRPGLATSLLGAEFATKAYGLGPEGG
jgi:hypothetical protein